MKVIEPPNIGAMIKAHVKKNRLRQNGWARQEGMNRRTVARYLTQKDIRVGTLFGICQSLNYNFLHVIAALLPDAMPPAFENPLQARVTELENLTKELEVQVKTLKEALELVGRK